VVTKPITPHRSPVGNKSLLKVLGPGLVTGASDDDPSGIATYSQVGAQFGFGMLWTMLFSYPLMVAIQLISAMIGRVTGRGIAGNMRRFYPHWLLYGIVLLVLVANVINLGADIGAMGAALGLLARGPVLMYSAAFAVVCIVLQVFVPYHRYENVLKGLTLSLFAYVGTAFVVHVPWGKALHATFVPSIKWNESFVTGLVAVLGTTISPYLFFWQASEEVEDEKAAHDESPLIRAPLQAPYQLRRMREDTCVGMAFSNIVAFFIILTAAATLHAHGRTDIQTSAQAALALRPIAGRFAFAIFTLGIVGTGLLAVPVMAGSAAYAVGEALHWPVGLERKLLQAKGFYSVLIAATLIGLGLNFVHLDPIKALFWSAVINGVAAGPIMAVMMVMTSDRRIMGQFTLKMPLRVVGWVATIVMLAAAVGLFATWGK
jgi:NRAMP (natural resistance-associated macrophage protein)-like metal ion transporter